MKAYIPALSGSSSYDLRTWTPRGIIKVDPTTVSVYQSLASQAPKYRCKGELVQVNVKEVIPWFPSEVKISAIVVREPDHGSDQVDILLDGHLVKNVSLGWLDDI